VGAVYAVQNFTMDARSNRASAFAGAAGHQVNVILKEFLI